MSKLPSPGAEAAVDGRSRYGRQHTLRSAAAYLGMTESRLYGLVRRRGITYHRVPGPPQVGRRRTPQGETGFVRGGDYFFYQSELDAWIEATRVDAVIDRPSTPAGSASPSAVDQEVAKLMPPKRRVS